MRCFGAPRIAACPYALNITEEKSARGEEAGECPDPECAIAKAETRARAPAVVSAALDSGKIALPIAEGARGMTVGCSSVPPLQAASNALGTCAAMRAAPSRRSAGIIWSGTPMAGLLGEAVYRAIDIRRGAGCDRIAQL